MPIVYYHGNCPDGSAAAWVVWKKYPTATFIPMGYETPVNYAELKDKIVIIVDFSFKPPVLAEIAEVAQSITMIDHHTTSAESHADYVRVSTACKNVFYKLETESGRDGKCGAVLAWEHFFKGEPVPELLKYVQDRDLWHWELDKSRAISAWLWSNNPLTPSVFEECLQFFNTRREICVLIGTGILQMQRYLIDQITKNATLMKIDGHDFWAVQTPVLQSEVCHELMEIKGTNRAATWYEAPECIHVSLRSKKPFDVSGIAKKFGGGGRAQTAGFELSLINDTIQLKKILASMDAAQDLINFYVENPKRRQSALNLLQGCTHLDKAAESTPPQSEQQST
jgi:hypothetical protein